MTQPGDAPRWLHASLHSFDPIALPGGYPNLLSKGDTDRARRSFGGNAERLIKAKRTYDPDNIFSSAIPLPVAQSSETTTRADMRLVLDRDISEFKTNKKV